MGVGTASDKPFRQPFRRAVRDLLHTWRGSTSGTRQIRFTGQMRGSTKAGHTSQTHRRTRGSLEECKAGTPARLTGCRGRAYRGGNSDFDDSRSEVRRFKTSTHTTGLGRWEIFGTFSFAQPRISFCLPCLHSCGNFSLSCYTRVFFSVPLQRCRVNTIFPARRESKRAPPEDGSLPGWSKVKVVGPKLPKLYVYFWSTPFKKGPRPGYYGWGLCAKT